MDSQLGEWRCCDVATGTPPSDSTRTTYFVAMPRGRAPIRLKWPWFPRGSFVSNSGTVSENR